MQFATAEQIVSVGEDKPSLSAQNLSDLNASLAQAQDARIRPKRRGRRRGRFGMGLPQVVSNR